MSRHAARTGLLASACLGVAVAAAPARVDAQTSLQIPLQFDFLNPGAKSMALGGAFVALADDATAPFANPAGLTQLQRPEISAELRFTRVSTGFLERGRLSGSISNAGIDTVQGPQFADSVGSHTGLGYLAAVYTRSPYRWVVAGYRHELVRVDQTFLSQGVFQKVPEEFTSRRDSPQEGVRNVAITGYGAAASFHPYQGRRIGVHVGGALTIYRFAIDSTFRRFDTEGFLGPANTAIELGKSTQHGHDVSAAPALGIQVAGARVRVGAAYRHGATFTFTTRDGIDPPRQVRFRVPDTLALGVSVRPRPVLTIAGEMTRVTYHRLRDDFVTDQARATQREDSFDIENGVELHAGIQYAMPAIRFRPRFRGGIWRDPDHSVHFSPSGVSVTAVDRLFDERLAVALSTGTSQVHVTGGLGLTLTPRLELNAAVDRASTTTRASASIILLR